MEQMILQDICKVYDCPHTTAKDEGIGIPLVRTPNIGKGRLLLTNAHRVNSDIYQERTRRAIPEEDDIIIAREAPVGNAAIIQMGQKVCLGQRVVLLKPIRDRVDPNYLVYYLLSDEIQHRLRIHANGAVVAHLNMADIRNLPVSLPSLSEQKKIGRVLKIIDDKIELNRRINDNLEQQAQALFDYYFSADSKYLSDSERGVLTNIAVYLNGLAMQKFPPTDSEHSLPVLKIKELGQGKCDNNSDRCSNDIDSNYVIDNGNIIFSWSGTLMVDVWCGGKCGLNQHLFKVTPLQDYPQWFIYYWTIRHLNTFKLIAKDKAVTMGHIKRVDLEKAEVIIPNKYSLVEMNAQIEPLYQSIINNRLQIAELETLRDALLPKLMSGELKINDLNC